ncbi:MAG: TIGR00725 family protein [Actinomycetota bacterium]|nr:TIGR00725 family protein [Actinomycetota bacterium]
MRKRPPYVAVVGPNDATRTETEQAEEVGAGLARAGAVLVCGGLGGVMHAAARGCERAGGVSVGILPGDDRDPGSPHLTVAISTGLGETRNALVVRASDAVIAISGEFGTLSEVAFALKIGKPVVGLHTWELAKDGRPVEAVTRVGSPDAAVAKALELARP